MSKILRNKAEKERSLFDAGFTLFTRQEIHETSISQISKTAGVGKGTFYLYFKDKYDLLDRLTIRKSNDILLRAMDITESSNAEGYDRIILFVLNVIDVLKEEKTSLKLIHKNLSWALLKRAKEEENAIHEIYAMFRNIYFNLEKDIDHIDKDLYLMLEIVGSLSYNAIIREEPYSLEDIKPDIIDYVSMIIKR